MTRCLCDVSGTHIEYVSEKVTLHSDIIGFNILQFSPFSFNIIFSLTFFSHQLLPSILTFALVSFVPCQVLVVPCLQMAHSDHLLMTVEHRKGVPAAAAWHPAQRAHTHLLSLSHKQTQTHIHKKKLHTFIALSSPVTNSEPPRQNLHLFLQCHTFIHCSHLLTAMILCCTFAPSPSLPSPPSSCLQLPLFHLLLWCY